MRVGRLSGWIFVQIYSRASHWVFRKVLLTSLLMAKCKDLSLFLPFTPMSFSQPPMAVELGSGGGHQTMTGIEGSKGFIHWAPRVTKSFPPTNPAVLLP